MYRIRTLREKECDYFLQTQSDALLKFIKKKKKLLN